MHVCLATRPVGHKTSLPKLKDLLGRIVPLIAFWKITCNKISLASQPTFRSKQSRVQASETEIKSRLNEIQNMPERKEKQANGKHAATNEARRKIKEEKQYKQLGEEVRWREAKVHSRKTNGTYY